jgi:dolichyl-diphosphooligosaccharide--protein glycosyltransferase
MKLSDSLSKERIINGLKNLTKLRVKANHSSLLTFSVLLLIAFVAFTIRILPMRWEIGSGVWHLSEFDPYYQYALTNHMVNNGLFSPYWPTQWVDYQHWYPYGLNYGNSLLSLPMSAALFYDIVSLLGVHIDLTSFCSLIPAVYGMVSVLILYFIGKDIGGKAVGMLSALFLALDAAVIQRSSLGFFDTETVGLFSLLLFILFFLRAIEEERPVRSTVIYSLGSAGALAYFIMGWGAAYYIIGLSVLFVFVLFLLKRYTRRLFLAYSLTFGLGLLIAINDPYISTGYLTESVTVPVAALFGLLCLNELVGSLTSARGKITFAAVFLAALVGGFTVMWTGGYLGGIAGKFGSVVDPFLRATAPLVESVAEQRIVSWSSIYFDIGIVILFFVAGLYFISRNLNNKNLFLLLFSLTSLYFASSMVRLLVILAPAVGLVSSVAIVELMRPFITLLKEPPKIVTKKKFGLEHVGKEFSGAAVFLIFLVLMTNFAFSPQSNGIPRVYGQVYTPVTISAGSLPITPSQPVSEWFDALKYLNNLPDSSTTVVCAWWDYGEWLAILGNVTTLDDNTTNNTTQIENVGFIFIANETQSLKMLDQYHAKYVLVFVTVGAVTSSSTGQTYGTFAGYGDEGKWTWMARISGSASAQLRFTTGGFLPEQSSWTNETTFGAYNSTTNRWVWNDVGTNTTIYKMMSWAKQRWCDDSSITPDGPGVEPTYFKEAYFAGVNLAPSDAGKYGGIVPLVCIYEIDWAKYHQYLGQ